MEYVRIRTLCLSSLQGPPLATGPHHSMDTLTGVGCEGNGGGATAQGSLGGERQFSMNERQYKSNPFVQAIVLLFKQGLFMQHR